MSRLQRACLAIAMVTAFIVAGCAEAEPEAKLEPKVAPPVIAEDGVLRVGVDLDYPPFAGKDKGREAGLDIDIAAALAAELGLELEIIDVTPDEASTSLEAEKADAVMSVPFTEEAMTSLAFAGMYVDDGPAFFMSQEGTSTSEDTSASVEPLSIYSVGSMTIGAQEGSEAYWILKQEYGDEFVTSYPTLLEAIEALDAGEIEAVAGSAAVVSYIAFDYPDVRFAGQLEPATSLGLAVLQDATELEEALREALDSLAASGVLETIRTKWLGEMPELETSQVE